VAHDGAEGRVAPDEDGSLGLVDERGGQFAGEIYSELVYDECVWLRDGEEGTRHTAEERKSRCSWVNGLSFLGVVDGFGVGDDCEEDRDEEKQRMHRGPRCHTARPRANIRRMGVMEAIFMR
jgi:hypothetical protein